MTCLEPLNRNRDGVKAATLHVPSYLHCHTTMTSTVCCVVLAVFTFIASSTSVVSSATTGVSTTQSTASSKVTARTKSTGIPSTSDRTSSLTPSITNTILPSASSSNGTPKTDNSSSTSLNTSSSTAVSKRTTMRTEAHSKTTLRTSTSNPTKATSTLIVSVSNSTEGDSGLSEEGQIAIIVVIIMGGAIGVTGVIALISRRLKPRRKKLRTNNLDSPGNQYAGEFGRDIDEMSTYSNRSRSTVTFQVDNNRH